MSVRLTRRVWDHSTARGTEKLVLLCLADVENEDGRGAWPSKATIAARTGIGPRMVANHLRDLVKRGELSLDRSGGPKGTNLYRVIVAEGVKCTSPQEMDFTEGCNVLHGGGETDFLGGVKSVSPKPEANQNRTGTNQKTSSAAEPPEALRGFDAILREAGPASYRPTPAFYAKVQEKYSGLDLEEEAIKFVGWLDGERAKRKKRSCTTAGFLNWLKNAASYQQEGRKNGNGRPGEDLEAFKHRSIASGMSRESDWRYLAELSK